VKMGAVIQNQGDHLWAWMRNLGLSSMLNRGYLRGVKKPFKRFFPYPHHLSPHYRREAYKGQDPWLPPQSHLGDRKIWE